MHILCIFLDLKIPKGPGPEAVQTIYVPQLHAVLLWETGCVSWGDCNVATDYFLQYCSDELEVISHQAIVSYLSCLEDPPTFGTKRRGSNLQPRVVFYSSGSCKYYI